MISAGRGPALLGDQGLITGVNDLLQVLIGFYIAALAAIATFHKPGMDEQMAGDPVTLEEEFRGDVLDVSLTRRRFLCYLFGYLAWIGLLVYAGGVAIGASHEDVKSLIPDEWLQVARNAGLFAYLFLLSNLGVTTMLGLYYMTHRIHLQEPKETPPN